jgi:hypothetical protein
MAFECDVALEINLWLKHFLRGFVIHMAFECHVALEIHASARYNSCEVA